MHVIEITVLITSGQILVWLLDRGKFTALRWCGGILLFYWITGQRTISNIRCENPKPTQINSTLILVVKTLQQVGNGNKGILIPAVNNSHDVQLVIELLFGRRNWTIRTNTQSNQLYNFHQLNRKLTITRVPACAPHNLNKAYTLTHNGQNLQ